MPISRERFAHELSLVLAPVFPCSISTRVRLAIVTLLWLVCRRAFPAPPRHTGGMRQVLEPFLPLPATPAVRGRFFMGGLCLVVGPALPSTAFLRVFLAPIARPLEVWDWVLRSRIFDSLSSS